MITINTILDMRPGAVPKIIHLSQYDSDFSLVFRLHASFGTLNIESGTTAEIRGTKKSGTGYSASATLNTTNNTVTVAGDSQMTAVAGQNIYEIVLTKNNKVLGSANFILFVERAALDADTITDATVLRNLEAIVEGAETATQAAEDAEDAADRAEAAAQSLVIDPTPTQGSAHAVSSGAVYDEIDNVKIYTSEANSLIFEILKRAAYLNSDSAQYIEELKWLIESGESGRVGDEELRNVILDTDFGNVDDYFGIRIVAQAHKNKLINVVGINASALVPSVADAQITAFSRFLNYEGLGAIDMGFNKNNMATSEGATVTHMREAISTNWSYGRYTSFNSVDSSVEFYRKKLAGIKGKVDIICIGGLAAISDLLDSTADSYSPMSGIELVSAKVDTLWVMGGKYPTGRSWNFYKNDVTKVSTNNVFQKYPGKIVFQGDELGASVICGSTLKDTVGTDDLLYKIMVAHTSSYGQSGCASHDAITTLLCVYGDISVAGYGVVVGTNTFNVSDGTNTFVESETGKHCYVVTHHSAEHHAYEINDIITKIGM